MRISQVAVYEFAHTEHINIVLGRSHNGSHLTSDVLNYIFRRSDSPVRKPKKSKQKIHHDENILHAKQFITVDMA